jgi:hypothetical protein
MRADQSAVDQSFTILEEMVCHNIRVYKVQVTSENSSLIRALKHVSRNFKGFSCGYIEVVQGKRWFVVRDMAQDLSRSEPTGELIVVDFRAKKVLSRSVA